MSNYLYTRLGFFTVFSSEGFAVRASLLPSNLFSWEVFSPAGLFSSLQSQPMAGPASVSSSRLFCLCKQAAVGPLLVCWSFRLRPRQPLLRACSMEHPTCISILQELATVAAPGSAQLLLGLGSFCPKVTILINEKPGLSGGWKETSM